VAMERWAAFRVRHGLSNVPVPLLTAPDGNAKFAKTEAFVYGLALAQSDSSGVNTCRFATPECRAACVSYAGKGELDMVKRARTVRTLFLHEDPDAFCTLLLFEVGKAWRKHGVQVRVRLNTFSDIPWERVFPELFERFPLVRFYDYTKWGATRTKDVSMSPNYHLTYSASEHTSDLALPDLTADHVNVAVVFGRTPSQPLPTTYMGVRVVDGDKSDDRFLDPQGVIVGLRAKGRMRRPGFAMVRAG
jgi:hypothetical protein